MSNLKNLYKQKLAPHLQSVEKDRVWIKKRVIITLIIVLILLFGVATIPNQIAMWIVISLLLLALLWAVGTGIVKYFTYRHEFKEKVVKEVVKFINPDYKYDAYQHISVTDFNASNLFKNAKMCRGDDYVCGKIDKTPFHYSEIIAGSVPGNNQNTKIKSVFKGLFFYADFNKELKGETYVLPDKAEKLLGKMGQQFQTGNKKGTLVKLENIEFEKEFVVYGSSQIEARYVLTPVIMEAIVKIRRKYKLNFYFSFLGNRINCAIKFSKNLFEPRVMSSGVSFADIEYMHELFGLIETIIKDMNLNTRIWTKE